MMLSIMILFIGDCDGDDANLLWLNVWWNRVLNSFWQMCALSAWASYLRWQTVWCHPGASLSNNNLWEFSSSPIFSKLLVRASHIQQNPGSNKGLRMQCTDRRFKTGFCHGRRRKRRKRRRREVDQNLKQRKRKLSKRRERGSAAKNSPLWPVVPLDSADQSDNVPIHTLLLLLW